MIAKVGSEAVRDCRNEELMRRLEEEARLTATEEICDEIVESVARFRFLKTHSSHLSLRLED